MSLPTQLLSDVRIYAPAIDRIAGLLSVFSLVPMVFASSSYLRRDRHERVQREAPQEDEPGMKPQVEQRKEQRVSVGGLCALLLLLSAVVGCLPLFVPSKGKGKAAALGFQALVKGLEKGKKAAKKSQSVWDNAAAAVFAALDSREAFDAACCLVTVVACASVLVALFLKAAPGWVGKLFSGGGGGRRGAALAVGVLWPLMVFGRFHQETLLKAWKAVTQEQVLPTLQLPLRMLALLASAGPTADGGGTPGLFAALQVGSLVSAISAELARGELSKAIAPFVQQPLEEAILMPAPHLLLVPTALAVLWLMYKHLGRNHGSLLVASLLCGFTSPAVVASGWPMVGTYFSLRGGKAILAQVVKCCSLGLATSTGMLVISGGTQGILVVMVMLQLLLQIHGHEALVAALS